jgi:murein DD-endopeptidase MepM/ murein hydrolase activator NlpD
VVADRGTWRLEISLDAAGLIAGLLVTEGRRPAPPIARSDVPLSLPFRGEWVVQWGGDRREVNHHVGAPDQRRAADLAMDGPDHKTHRGDGRSNADYLVYGQEVLAVADGIVETVVDGVPENVPHDENHYVVYGNYVLVRHGPSLFSGYMHLQPGQMRVKPGMQVKRGAVIGLVGNSGNSTEPHLHFQLQDGPDGNKSWGVDPVFERVVVTRDGRTDTVSGYTFLRGDHIRQP